MSADGCVQLATRRNQTHPALSSATAAGSELAAAICRHQFPCLINQMYRVVLISAFRKLSTCPNTPPLTVTGGQMTEESPFRTTQDVSDSDGKVMTSIEGRCVCVCCRELTGAQATSTSNGAVSNRSQRSDVLSRLNSTLLGTFSLAADFFCF